MRTLRRSRSLPAVGAKRIRVPRIKCERSAIGDTNEQPRINLATYNYKKADFPDVPPRGTAAFSYRPSQRREKLKSLSNESILVSTPSQRDLIGKLCDQSAQFSVLWAQCLAKMRELRAREHPLQAATDAELQSISEGPKPENENAPRTEADVCEDSKFSFLQQCALSVPYKLRTYAQQAMLRIYMRNSPFLHGLTIEAQHRLLSSSHVHQVEEGRAVFRKGDLDDRTFYILKGVIGLLGPVSALPWARTLRSAHRDDCDGDVELTFVSGEIFGGAVAKLFEPKFMKASKERVCETLCTTDGLSGGGAPKRPRGWSLVREVFFPDGIKGVGTTFSLALKAVRSRKGRQYAAVAKTTSILLSVPHPVLQAAALARRTVPDKSSCDKAYAGTHQWGRFCR